MGKENISLSCERFEECLRQNNAFDDDDTTVSFCQTLQHKAMQRTVSTDSGARPVVVIRMHVLRLCKQKQ